MMLLVSEIELAESRLSLGTMLGIRAERAGVKNVPMVAWMKAIR